MEELEPGLRERPPVRVLQLLQEKALTIGVGVRHALRILRPPDLGDEVEPAVQQLHGGAVVVRNQLTQLLDSLRGARSDRSFG